MVIDRLFGRKPPAYAVPDSTRVYAIGDIHGRLDLTQRMLAEIERDLAGFEGAAEIVFLGDYVDRGPDSAGVVARVAAGPPPGQVWRTLRGNHEAIMLSLLDEPAANPRLFRSWQSQGGAETMRSYGLSHRLAFGDDSGAAMAALAEAMPPGHVGFLRELLLMHRVGDYLFVHAGIRPNVALEEQDEQDLLWIREDFLDHRGAHGVHVVHGHTIREQIEVRPHRTGVDTGAYASGRLSALVLEGTERRTLST